MNDCVNIGRNKSETLSLAKYSSILKSENDFNKRFIFEIYKEGKKQIKKHLKFLIC